MLYFVRLEMLRFLLLKFELLGGNINLLLCVACTTRLPLTPPSSKWHGFYILQSAGLGYRLFKYITHVKMGVSWRIRENNVFRNGEKCVLKHQKSMTSD